MHEQEISKAKVLIEALPYIKTFRGKTVVIKYGGAAMTDPKLKPQVMQDIVLMKYVGMKPVLVHGGGPEITKAMQALGKQPVFVDGRRVTDLETMQITEMVLVGKLNQEIVALLNGQGGEAVGLSGKDGNLITARKLMAGAADLGFVGEVTAIKPDVINTLDRDQFIPVIAPIGRDDEGNTYNINADDVAAAVAIALNADKLVLLTDVPGILSNPQDPGSLLSTLRVRDIADMVARGVITGGMQPKVRACERALNGGVGKTHIIDGRIPHALLLEIFTDQGIGTEMVV
ncbi:MAG: acetylglutamate kinase [Candidatus Firestonebacteria bacterium]|nr:acetylglutamate kinase [Candidatus Firestonebacteria bacterium]